EVANNTIKRPSFSFNKQSFNGPCQTAETESVARYRPRFNKKGPNRSFSRDFEVLSKAPVLRVTFFVQSKVFEMQRVSSLDSGTK
ncbi:MAG: hypothetical protein AAGK05_10360, partial [Pseudomonadota bacterium]